MKSRTKIIGALIVIIVIIFGLKMCANNDNNEEQVAYDQNIIELKTLVYEEELCDDEWAKKFDLLGDKIIKDSNQEYLEKYYDIEINEDFINNYKQLGELCKKFSTLFISKSYSEASEVLNKIKEIYNELEK